MLCEKCQKKEADHHLTIITGDTLKKMDLCRECFDESVPSDTNGLTAAQHEALCEYCGAQACAGGVNFPKFMCLVCSTEYDRYMEKQFEQLVKRFSKQTPQEPSMLLESHLNKADQHMRQWVSEKANQQGND